MTKKHIALFIVLFLVGIGLGILGITGKARATNPGCSGGVCESSIPAGGEDPPSVYYDERWSAVETLVSYKDRTTLTKGYKYFYPHGSPAPYPVPETPANIRTDSVVATESAARMEEITSANRQARVEVFPKMIVTRWKVHGHIHFF